MCAVGVWCGFNIALPPKLCNCHGYLCNSLQCTYLMCAVTMVSVTSLALIVMEYCIVCCMSVVVTSHWNGSLSSYRCCHISLCIFCIYWDISKNSVEWGREFRVQILWHTCSLKRDIWHHVAMLIVCVLWHGRNKVWLHGRMGGIFCHTAWCYKICNTNGFFCWKN